MMLHFCAGGSWVSLVCSYAYGVLFSVMLLISLAFSGSFSPHLHHAFFPMLVSVLSLCLPMRFPQTSVWFAALGTDPFCGSARHCGVAGAHRKGTNPLLIHRSCVTSRDFWQACL
jgi:hypothetical protein